MTKLVLAAWLLCLCFAIPTAANERWVVLPFENVSSKPEYHWLGEGLALLLSDLLSIPGVDVVAPEERRAAYALLSFSETTVLSRASAIRVAQELGADLLLVGTYKVTGPKNREQVAVSAQLIDVPAGRLAQDSLEAGAPLAELVELQGILAWNILLSQRVPVTISRNQFMARLQGVSPRVFELYVKAVLAQDLSTRTELLRLALKHLGRTKPDLAFDPALYELGKVYYLQPDCAAAISWLSKVKPGGLYYRDAQFCLGLCYYYQGELDKAASVYTELTRLIPSAGVFNNLAVIETKRRQFTKAVDYLTIALTREGDSPDLWFNYGYALWLNGNYETAVTKLREAVRRRPNDGAAHYLLAKCLAQLGLKPEADAALQEAKKYLPTVAQWERTGQVPMLARVVRELDWLALSQSAKK